MVFQSFIFRIEAMSFSISVLQLFQLSAFPKCFVRIGQHNADGVGLSDDRFKFPAAGFVIAIGDAHNYIVSVQQMRTAPDCFIIRMRDDHQRVIAGKGTLGNVRQTVQFAFAVTGKIPDRFFRLRLYYSKVLRQIMPRTVQGTAAEKSVFSSW